MIGFSSDPQEDHERLLNEVEDLRIQLSRDEATCRQEFESKYRAKIARLEVGTPTDRQIVQWISWARAKSWAG